MTRALPESNIHKLGGLRSTTVIAHSHTHTHAFAARYNVRTHNGAATKLILSTEIDLKHFKTRTTTTITSDSKQSEKSNIVIVCVI